MEEKKYDLLKEAYNKGEIFISVDLAKARQVLTQIEYKPVVFFQILMYILLLICCISSFFSMGWFGLLYSVIYLTIWFSFLGTCSLPQSRKYGSNIVIIGIIFAIISIMFFNFDMTFLVIISFIELYLAYYLYRFSARELIDNFVFKDRYFNAWINDVFVIKINPDYKEDISIKDKEENENLEKFIELLEKENLKEN